MHEGTPRRRRARPVADASVEELLGRCDELAKGWLLELVESAPLSRAAAILAGPLAQEGPTICAAVIGALASDAELAALQAGGELVRLASQAGAIAAAGEIDGLEALRGVIWTALRRELKDPDADLVGALAERLALVSATLRTAAVTPVGEAADVAVLEPEGAAGRGGHRLSARRLDLVESEPTRSSTSGGESLWVAAIDDEIDRAKRLGASLSLLLVELEDADRVVAVEAPRDATAMFSRFAQGMRTAVRRHDILACETDTRAWVIARDSGRMAAQALGVRIAGAVRSAGTWRGAPLSVGVGLAVLGQDGHDRAGLMEAAEESRFAAVAGGTGVLDREPTGE